MSRPWITGIAIAGVVGSGGAAFAAMSDHTEHAAPAAPAIPQAVASQSTAAPAGRSMTYQVGPAGTVTVSIADGVLTVTEVTPGAGWTVLGANGPAAHVDAQFTDGTQLVTFGADLAGDDVSVSLRNESYSGGTTVAQPPMTVTVISGGGSGPGTTQPKPAQPGPTAPSQSTPTTHAPAPPATSAPSSGGDDDDDDDHDDDDGEDDGEEHDDD